VIAPEVMEKDQWLATRGQPRCFAADDGYASGAHKISKLGGPAKRETWTPDRAQHAGDDSPGLFWTLYPLLL
jgi:hypothetical protein